MNNKWEEFFGEWKQELCTLMNAHPTEWADGGLPNVAMASFWPTGAAKEEIDQSELEHKVGASLPREAFDMAMAIDGFPLVGFGEGGRVLPISQWGKFCDLSPSVFSVLPQGANGNIRKLEICSPDFQAATSLDRNWLSNAIQISDDGYRDSDLILLVPLEVGAQRWMEFWLDSNGEGVTRFESLFELMTYLRQRLMAAIPYQIGLL